ncbi:hypothetical protein [Chromobacterium piscinae]|uniref:hypothetical protein n=1 Tax=Chromobacterium piscinae TaxID=686831 RepID=UPI00320B3640
MKQSSEFLKDAIEMLGEENDSKAAARLKIAKSTLSLYLSGTRIMDDFACVMVAEALGIDAMKVIAAAQMEREKNQERREVWENLRKKIGALGLAGWVAGAALLLHPDLARADGIHGVVTQHFDKIAIYIMSNDDDTPDGGKNCLLVQVCAA